VKVLVAAAALLACAGLAAADTTVVPKKKTPDKFARAAANAFTEALEADEKGDLRTALGLYTKAQEIAPHPSTAYNVGDIYRRQGDTRKAVLYFEMYLAMLPAAPDRAYVEQLIEKLEKEPVNLRLSTGPKSDPNSVEFREFYILVDGEIVVKPGTDAKAEPGGRDQKPVVLLKVTGGKHQIDLVSSISYAHTECDADPGKPWLECNVHAKPRVDGHLVIRGSDAWIGAHLDRTDKDKAVNDGRYEMPPGHQRIRITDHSFECRALFVDIPSGANDVAYLYVGSHEYDFLERCRNLDVKVKKLHFD
jgi:hypothetical protein